MEAPWKHDGSMGVPLKRYGSIMEVHQSTMEAPWKNHGRTMLPRKHHGITMEASWKHIPPIWKRHESAMEIPMRVPLKHCASVGSRWNNHGNNMEVHEITMEAPWKLIKIRPLCRRTRLPPPVDIITCRSSWHV